MSMTDQDIPAVPAEEAADEAAMQDWAELLVERARAEGVELTGDGGLLTGLVRQVLQTGLEVEMQPALSAPTTANSAMNAPAVLLRILRRGFMVVPFGGGSCLCLERDASRSEGGRSTALSTISSTRTAGRVQGTRQPRRPATNRQSGWTEDLPDHYRSPPCLTTRPVATQSLPTR